MIEHATGLIDRYDPARMNGLNSVRHEELKQASISV
jgi:hypothetical protein